MPRLLFVLSGSGPAFASLYSRQASSKASSSRNRMVLPRDCCSASTISPLIPNEFAEIFLVLFHLPQRLKDVRVVNLFAVHPRFRHIDREDRRLTVFHHHAGKAQMI